VLRFLFSFLLLISTAQAYDFTIREYTTTVKVNSDNTADVFEDIKVHFNVPKHGIYRVIPFKRGSGIYDIRVFQDGEKANIHRLSRKGNSVEVVIGYPDRLVSGDVDYQILYRVFKPFDISRGSVEVGINLIGTQWRTKISSAYFQVDFPRKPENVKLFCGKEGSRACPGGNLHVEGERVTGYIGKELKPFEGVSLFATLPGSAFHDPSFSEQLRFYIFWYPYVPLLLLFILILFSLWYVFGRDRRPRLVVRFKPPEDVPPQEAGIIYDNSLDGRDVVAMILSWAERGYVRIDEVEKGSLLFRRKDYSLSRLKDADSSFKPYERKLFRAIFFKPSVRLSELKRRTSLFKVLRDVRKEMLKEVDSYAYSGKTLIIGNLLVKLSKVAIAFIAVFSFPFVVPFFVAILGRDRSLFQLFSTERLVLYACAVILFVSIYIFGRAITKRSDRGSAIYEKLIGFREFFKRVEKPVLERMLKEEPDYFSRYMPYAAALNILDIWVEKFSGILKSPPDWYRGDISRIDTGFSKSFSGAFAAVSGTSSGFASGSSGGVGGGSVGGGGGGSW